MLTIAKMDGLWFCYFALDLDDFVFVLFFRNLIFPGFVCIILIMAGFPGKEGRVIGQTMKVRF